MKPTQRRRKWKMWARISLRKDDKNDWPEISETYRGFHGKTWKTERIIRVEVREIRRGRRAG